MSHLLNSFRILLTILRSRAVISSLKRVLQLQDLHLLHRHTKRCAFSGPMFCMVGTLLKFSHCLGHVSFRTGRHSYGSDIKVDIRFKGESVNELFTYHIREFGLSYNSYAFKKGCSDAGATFRIDDHIGKKWHLFPNSLGPDGTALYTWPQFVRAEIGDLSGRHGRLRGDQSKPLFFQDSQVASLLLRPSFPSQVQLSGPHSVMGRSIVILDLKGKDVGCCTISAVPLQALEDWDHYDVDHHHHEDRDDFEAIPEEIIAKEEGVSNAYIRF